MFSGSKPGQHSVSSWSSSVPQMKFRDYVKLRYDHFLPRPFQFIMRFPYHVTNIVQVTEPLNNYKGKGKVVPVPVPVMMLYMFWRRETLLGAAVIRTPDCPASSLVTVQTAICRLPNKIQINKYNYKCSELWTLSWLCVAVVSS